MPIVVVVVGRMKIQDTYDWYLILPTGKLKTFSSLRKMITITIILRNGKVEQISREAHSR